MLSSMLSSEVVFLRWCAFSIAFSRHSTCVEYCDFAKLIRIRTHLTVKIIERLSLRDSRTVGRFDETASISFVLLWSTRRAEIAAHWPLNKQVNWLRFIALLAYYYCFPQCFLLHCAFAFFRELLELYYVMNSRHVSHVFSIETTFLISAVFVAYFYHFWWNNVWKRTFEIQAAFLRSSLRFCLNAFQCRISQRDLEPFFKLFQNVCWCCIAI